MSLATWTLRIWMLWQRLSIHTVGERHASVFSHTGHLYAGYLDRYRKMKILQIQTSGDEFFLPDNEVNKGAI